MPVEDAFFVYEDIEAAVVADEEGECFGGGEVEEERRFADERIIVDKFEDKTYFVRNDARKKMGLDFIEETALALLVYNLLVEDLDRDRPGDGSFLNSVINRPESAFSDEGNLAVAGEGKFEFVVF